ncbi:protease modulator HflC [Pseudomarimonas salicorniae]|uniref:Protein HflC n=1 Tax=Pseudomarimonas salicorniae TaxID=2933270 RepID=A0ABT0GDI4_9GAMM|nr:protease modulator HflC [Lysobacter sp. CAU 1642]MCK7592611.1 protease modulator HflC [Lysobacter sp. CAU 1642]
MKPAIPIVIIILLFLAMDSVYQVQESQVAVRFQIGRIVETEIQPGFHLKLPLVQNVLKFDRRILSLDGQPERYLTSEKKDVNVDFFVKWRIDDVRRFYQATAGNEINAQQRLSPIVKEAIRNEINQRTLKDVVGGERTNLAERFVEVANPAAESLGVKIVDIRIKRIDLPEDGQVIGSVFERMRAERLRVANELRAEGTEQSETIRSNADRQRAIIVAEAERDAQRLRGEGDAEAADTYARAYQDNVEFYAFYRSLEAYRNGFADGEGVLVLDKNAEFLRYFERGGTPQR